jgi:hypothetical protein
LNFFNKNIKVSQILAGWVYSKNLINLGYATLKDVDVSDPLDPDINDTAYYYLFFLFMLALFFLGMGLIIFIILMIIMVGFICVKIYIKKKYSMRNNIVSSSDYYEKEYIDDSVSNNREIELNDINQNSNIINNNSINPKINSIDKNYKIMDINDIKYYNEIIVKNENKETQINEFENYVNN